MATKYFSFLICDHGSVQNLYYNGLPIGTVKDGRFTPEARLTPDGNSRPITMRNLVEPARFETAEELKAHLHALIDKIDIPK